MRTLLISTAAIALAAASASTSFACPYHSASESTKMTVAEAPVKQAEEAMSTFDPNEIKLEEEKKAE